MIKKRISQSIQTKDVIEGISEIKRISKDILFFFADVCKKHGIKFYLAYGTCLGAVRHKGFIPWDDDIDIAIFRDDYDKIKRVFNDSTQDYLIIDPLLNKKYDLPLAKIIDKRTGLLQTDNKNIFELGVYIDVFVMDCVPDSERKRSSFFKNMRRYQNRWFYSHTYSNSKSAIRRLFGGLVRLFYSIFFGPKYFSRKIWKNCIKSNSKYNRLVSNITYSIVNYEKGTFDKSVFGDGVLMPFEGRLFLVPEKFDVYLSQIYGDDYMTPPDKSKQISTHNYVAYYK